MIKKVRRPLIQTLMCSSLCRQILIYIIDKEFHTIVSFKYPDTQISVFKPAEEGAFIKTMVRIAKHNSVHK